MSSLRFVELDKSAANADKPWILVYLVGSLGDTIVCIPALEALRRQFPDDKIILLHDYQTLVSVTPLDIVPRKFIDGSLSYVMHRKPWAKIRELLKLRRFIKSKNVKACVYLVASERFGWLVSRDKLFFQSCGIKKLIGFYDFKKADLYARDSDGNPILQPSEAVLKLQRLERDGINIENLNFTERLLDFTTPAKFKVVSWLESRRQTNLKLIAMCPGCKRSANDWGIDNFIEIGKRLIATGEYEIVILGGRTDSELAQKMIAAWGAGIDATGEFNPNESGVLFSRCEFMIGNDTGSTHLAAAGGIPCFTVYHFRDNPGHWFPLGKGHQIVQHAPICAGCHLTECPKPNHPCMTEISVEAVWNLLTDFRREKPRENYARTLV